MSAGEMEVAALGRLMTNHMQSVTTRLQHPAPLSSSNLFLAGGVILAGLVALRFLAPKLAGYLNKRSDPWAPLATPAAATSTLRAEDNSFSAFVASFRNGYDAPCPDIQVRGVAPPEDTTPRGVQESDDQEKALADFLAKAPEQLARVRRLTAQLTAVSSQAARHGILKELCSGIRSLKESAELRDLLPFWQLTSALEGLLKQLTAKSSDITPSAIGTVIGATDLFEALCVRGLKPNLATSPPVRLLVVDDDPISRHGLCFSLIKALTQPDVAPDGQAALALCAKQSYDVIFLDVQMPGLDGFQLCSKIHDIAINKSTPVVFVTGQSDFESRAKSARIGGQDLIGKPFLTFEITVKALTLVLRRRLQPEFRELQDAEPAVESESSHESEAHPATPDDSADKSEARKPGPASLTPAQHCIRAFFRQAPAHLRALEDQLQILATNAGDEEKQEILGDLFLGIHSLACEAEQAKLHSLLRLICALEGMFKKLLEDPARATKSLLANATAAIALLRELCEVAVETDLNAAPIRILVVDDDPVSLRAISGALQLAFGRPEKAGNGEDALALAAETTFDVIFLDIHMPGINGFEVCSKLKETATNGHTPVVFVSGQFDSEIQTKSTSCGGSGFVPKPVMSNEITVLALTLVMRARLQKVAKRNKASAPSTEAEPALAEN
jgi:PleD family two-component response regulator